MEIKSAIAENKKIFGNMASLGLLQIANYLIPIAVLPFIVRSLSVEMIGKVSYAQNIIQYFTIIILFGFDYSATREIAIHKDDHETVKRIFWSVVCLKTVLLSLSFSGLLLMSVLWGKVQNDLILYLVVFLVNIGFAFFPSWFFQGMEDMKTMALLNFLTKFFGTGLSVFFINSPEDYLIFAAMPAVAYMVFGLFSFGYVIKKYDLSGFGEYDLKKDIAHQFKLSFPIFLNSFFTTLYTTANITILGLFIPSDYTVGIFSGAHKIIMCVLMITSMPINVAIYPSIGKRMSVSKNEGFRYFLKVGKYVVASSVVISVVTYFMSPLLVKILLGAEFEPSIPILRVFSCLPFLVITASLCTVQGLYGLGDQKYAPIVGLTVGIACVAMNFCFIPKFGVFGAAYSWIIAQALEILVSGFIIYKKSKEI